MPYFFLQHDDYVALKARVASAVLAGTQRSRCKRFGSVQQSRSQDAGSKPFPLATLFLCCPSVSRCRSCTHVDNLICILKRTVVSNAPSMHPRMSAAMIISGGTVTPEGVATLTIGIETMKVAEKLTPLLKEQLC